MKALQEYYVDNLRVRIYTTRDQMGKACAFEAGKKIRHLLEEKETVNIIFASSPSQLDALGSLRVEKDIDWGRVQAFIMDEYVGLPADAPQTFGYFLKTRFFSKLPFRQVFYINGNVSDLKAECDRYASLLRQNPVDITFAGIGENGHLAFNDPHIANFNDPLLVKVNKAMDPTCRQQQVTDGWFNSLEDVPHQAITLTMPALTAAQYIFAIVPGSTKQMIVKRCLEGPISTECPGTILRKHPAAQLYLDVVSATLLKAREGISSPDF